MPTGRYGFGLVAQPGSYTLYAFGGLVSDTEALTATERYNTCSRQWETRAPLPEPRGYVMAVEIDGKYYVVGGVDQIVSGTFGVRNTTYVYDPAEDTWTRRADLPQALGGVALATANGKLYAFGGFDQRGYNHGNVAVTYEYNPATNKWRERAAAPVGTRSLAGAASLNGKIYVVGGITDGDVYTSTMGAMTIYDPVANTWQFGAPVSPAHSLALAVAPDNAIYAFGGEGGEGPLSYRYDPVRDKWDSLSTYYLDEFRSGVGAAYSRGRLFIVGGYESFFNLTTQNVESLRLFDDLCLSSLTVDREVAQPGDRLRYTIELHSGIEVLDAVSAIDALPQGVQFAGFISNPIGASFNSTLNQIEWHGVRDSYAPPITITFEALVTPDLKPGQRLTNTLAVDSGAGWSMALSAVTAIDYFDLSSSAKLIDRSTLASNGIATYTIRVASPSALSGTVVISDPLPAGTTYLIASRRPAARRVSRTTPSGGKVNCPHRLLTPTPAMITSGAIVAVAARCPTCITTGSRLPALAGRLRGITRRMPPATPCPFRSRLFSTHRSTPRWRCRSMARCSSTGIRKGGTRKRWGRTISPFRAIRRPAFAVSSRRSGTIYFCGRAACGTRSWVLRRSAVW